MIDFTRGAKTTGSKFYFNVGDSAWEELELIYRMIGFHQEVGYKVVIPPYLVKREIGEWAGQLPRFEGDYYMTTDDLMLLPTAETALVGLHANEIFKEEDLPIKYVAFSPCFRREAGTYGRRDRGLRRVHQFHKIELFIICKPEDGEKLHQEMIEHIGKMLDMFGVEYRMVELSKKDRSPVSNKTIDLEVKYKDEWLEVSSISNTGDNQSKIAQIRYKDQSGKNIKVHLLNGSGVALPRFMMAYSERQTKTFSSQKLVKKEEVNPD